jgi:type VI secretion system FHA domain protein
MAPILKLIVVGYVGEPRPGLSKRFGEGRLTIGRGLDNDWVLPDPEKCLSNHHCLIEHREGRYVIRDTSRNGVFLNGNEAPLGNGRSSVLSHGDRVLVGDYEIRVEIDGSAGGATPFSAAFTEHSATLIAGVEPVTPPFGVRDDPFAPLPIGEPFAPLARSEPFASLPGGDPGWPDLAAALPQGSGAPPSAATPDLAKPVGGGRAGAPDPNHVAAIDSFFRAPKVKSPIIPPDWNPLAPEDAPGLPETPDLASFDPPAPPAASPVPRPSPPIGAFHIPETTAGAPGLAAEMLRAFLDGAGLSGAAVEPADPAASLHHYGEILRELISGVRELMATRALMKSEFRIEQTIIRARDNNALKFSVDLEQALRAMLLPQGAGYAEPLAAAREAVADLKAHEIALIAGLEKAVAHLLEALAPAELERSIEAAGMLASVLPAARKARYWDAYGTLYKKLAEQIREDVHGVFRQSFAEAYSEQVKKL